MNVQELRAKLIANGAPAEALDNIIRIQGEDRAAYVFQNLLAKEWAVPRGKHAKEVGYKGAGGDTDLDALIERGHRVSARLKELRSELHGTGMSVPVKGKKSITIPAGGNTFWGTKALDPLQMADALDALTEALCEYPEKFPDFVEALARSLGSDKVYAALVAAAQAAGLNVQVGVEVS